VEAPDQVGSVGNRLERPHFELSRRDEGVARIGKTVPEDDEPIDRSWRNIACADRLSGRRDSHEHGEPNGSDQG
jgi:hypothetical protein